MRNKIFFLFIFASLFSFNFRVSANELCSSNGYTILTVNGIFTNREEASENKRALEDKLIIKSFHNQPLMVDFLYNETHTAGVSDLLDAAAQSAFNEKNDYDLTNMLNDASQKVKTQKLLLVAHSQGNFYANNFYDKVASKEGGVPKESIGMYGVASPASRVAGGGKYLTSSTDRVIRKTKVWGLLNVLPANVTLPLKPIDGNGHSFSDVYLKYKDDRIVSDIKYSLNKLKNNDEQNPQESCISAPKLTTLHKIKAVLFAAADPKAETVKAGIVGIYKAGAYIANAGANAMSFLFNNGKYLVKRIGNFTVTSLASVGDSLSGDTPVVENPIVVENPQPVDPVPVAVEPVPVVEDLIPTIPEEIIVVPEVLPMPEVLPKENLEIIVTNPAPILETNPVPISPPSYGGSGYSGGGSNPDTTAPVISIIGDNPMSLEINSTYIELGATAQDNVDTTVTVVSSGTVDVTAVGVYIITYTATDLAGNTGTITRTVNIFNPAIPDTTAPVISIIGDNPLSINKDSTYEELGATAIDDVDVTVTTISTGVVDTSIVGTYTVTYTATDSAGNIATMTRIVNVIDLNIPDTTPPVITLNGNETEVIAVNSVYNDLGATASDVIDGVVNVSVVSTVNTVVVGIYTVTYSATDNSSNTSTKIRTVIVDSGAKLDNPQSVFVSGNYAYVVSTDSNSLEIIDISNPSLLVHKSSVVHRVDGIEMFNPKSVFVSGNYAYVVSYSDALEIIDISNPSLPIHKKTFFSGDDGSRFIRPIEIFISGNYAYILAYGSKNVDILDISDPISPRYKGFYYINSLVAPTSLFIRDNYMYLVYAVVGSEIGGLHIIDISDPTTPHLKGQITSGENGVSISNPQSVFVSGNYAYITSRGHNAFEIVDISNPENPIHSSVIRDEEGGASLHVPISAVVSGNYAYVALFNGSALEVLDISNPALPIHKATLPNNITGASLYYANKIFISGDYAYITAALSDALEIVDISNPLFPIHAGKILNGEFTHTTLPTIYNSEKKFLTFNFSGLNPQVVGTIDEINHTISLTVPNETNVIALGPYFTISAGAATVPTFGEGKDFTNPRNYLVFAEDGSTQNYVVTVTKAPLPDVPLAVSSYTLNGLEEDFSILKDDPFSLSLTINASKNVDWMSIKIESTVDPSNYKIFQSGATCVDGTSTCEKTWDGTLSSGGSLQVGTYRIKLHIKDIDGNEFYDYLTPYVINVVVPL